MFGSLAKHVVVNTIGVLVLATACLTSAFSLDTVPIWAPSSDHASYVFLRPKAASSIVSKGIAGSIAEAVVRVSASQDEVAGDGKQRLLAAYRLFVNGVEISQGPGRGDVATTSTSEVGNAIFDTIRITDKAVFQNRDTLTVALQCFHGDGGTNAWAMLELEAYDSNRNKLGETLRTNTDDWVAFDADQIFSPGIPDSCGRVNENIKANLFAPISRWRDEGFEPSAAQGWKTAEMRSPLVLPIAKETLPLHVQTGLEPVLMTRVGENHWFFDFGVEAMSGISLVIPSQNGLDDDKLVEIRLSEQLNGSNTVLYPETSKNKYISTCTIAKKGDDSVIEHHEYPGLWRYGELRFLDQKLIPLHSIVPLEFKLTRWTVAYPFDPSASRFESSNSMLNEVWGLCKRSLEITSLDTFTDSNTRERLPYEADGYITARTRWSTQQEYNWPKHSIRHVLYNPTWPTEWKQFTILLVHEHYMMTGDLSIVKDDITFDLLVNNTMLPFINKTIGLVDWTGKVVSHKYGSFCHSTKGYFPPGVSDGGQSCDIVDWHPGWRYRLGYNFTEYNTVVNAFAVKSLELLAELANAIGRTREAEQFSRQAATTRAAMIRHMYNAHTGMFCDGLCADTASPGTYHSQHFPLWLGVTPTEGLAVAHKYLTKMGIVGSVYTTHSIIFGLYERTSHIDYGQTALELMTQCSNQSWCNMLAHNATTSWEMWGPTEGTHSHPWSTTPGSAVAFGLFGIRPTDPGWGKWRIKIASGNLTFGNISVPSPHGPISANFTRSNRLFRLDVAIPKGTTCNACLPLFQTQGPSTKSVLVNKVSVQGQVMGGYVCIDGLVRMENQVTELVLPFELSTV